MGTPTSPRATWTFPSEHGQSAFPLQRLRAAFHYTVAGLCEEVGQDTGIQFSKQAVAAITEITFKQCGSFAKDLEMFAKHAKRTTINMEDVKLLARRSNSLLRYITQKSEELALNNLEQKEKRKKKTKKGRSSDEPAEPAAAESEDSNMA
ncbi:centromere protein S isoform X2 [Sceloporus undulatus]|uniref:centromere protein S isoform X2 n=1 Tax=Sceloporus undulatus TaxID=8520 RepID=UPI001C4BB1E7|nr:centromere protein S isoform X2 [Sceloporus undulatus]